VRREGFFFAAPLSTVEGMKKYLPSLDKVAQEVIATGFALIVVSYLVANVPALRKLVKDYQL
jgi:hypothetical protein